MKKNSLFILITLLTIYLFSGCSLSLNHYEDKLYSEKIFTDYTEQSIDENPNVFTREKAIEKVLQVFDKGFQKKIDRTSLSESIRLFKDSAEGSFKWQINWLDSSTKESYSSVVDSSNGEIISISIYSVALDDVSTPSEKRKEEYNHSRSEIIEIASPLLSALQIDTENYSNTPIKDTWIYRKIYYPYQVYLFYSNDSKEDIFTLAVDFENKRVISYVKGNFLYQY